MSIGHISLNGSKAAGKSTLADSLAQTSYGQVAQFYLARYEFQRWYLPVFDPNVELSKWKRHTALLCFALDWHRRLKHLEGRIIFDHYYADYLVQQLSSLKELDVLLKFIEKYDLPSFSEGHHFFIDTDYETYMVRREKRLNEQPEYRRDLTLIEKGQKYEMETEEEARPIYNAYVKEYLGYEPIGRWGVPGQIFVWNPQQLRQDFKDIVLKLTPNISDDEEQYGFYLEKTGLRPVKLVDLWNIPIHYARDDYFRDDPHYFDHIWLAIDYDTWNGGSSKAANPIPDYESPDIKPIWTQNIGINRRLWMYLEENTQAIVQIGLYKSCEYTYLVDKKLECSASAIGV